MKISRRQFLAGVAGAAATTATLNELGQGVLTPQQLIEEWSSYDEEFHVSICQQCPGGCGILARVVDGELLWLVDGYLPAMAFPLAPRAEWNGRRIAGLRGALLGTVAAQTGTVHVYLRPGSDPLAAAWAAIAEGVIEPSSALPEAVWRAAPYPVDLLKVQARQLERSPRRLGVLSGRSGADPTELPRPDLAWADTTGVIAAMPSVLVSCAISS